MKLLFLDMDGVLNSEQSDIYFDTIGETKVTDNHYHWTRLCPIALSNLNYLLGKIPELRIVISSAWRCYFDLSEWDKQLKERCPNITGRVIGSTPKLFRKSRGTEIYQWLKDNGHLCTPYIIFDDNTDMDGVADRFSQIDPVIGLTLHDVVEAIELLNKEIL